MCAEHRRNIFVMLKIKVT